MPKTRLDSLVFARRLAPSREQARRLIEAGQVTVDGIAAIRPGALVRDNAQVEVATRPRFVSRGGDKLDAALERFGLDVAGLVCADVGASTGGFTDCLLQRGAARVYAIDVGHDILAPALRQVGVKVTQDRSQDRSRERLLYLQRPQEVGFLASAASVASAPPLAADATDVTDAISPTLRGRAMEGGHPAPAAGEEELWVF